MTAAEKNAHYGKLNSRFDERAAALMAMGFKYHHIPGISVAVFLKERFGRNHAIQTAAVTHADEIVWADEMERAERFCA